MAKPDPIQNAAPCPLCGQPADPAFRPFCSRGCKDRDLLQWLGEGYRIAGPPADDRAMSGDDEPA